MRKPERSSRGEFDQKYYACAKDVNEYLEEYLENNLSDFIELI